MQTAVITGCSLDNCMADGDISGSDIREFREILQSVLRIAGEADEFDAISELRVAGFDSAREDGFLVTDPQDDVQERSNRKRDAHLNVTAPTLISDAWPRIGAALSGARNSI